MSKRPFTELVPPHNAESEQAVLGALLLDDEAIGVATQILRPDDFYSNANRRVYQIILQLSNQNHKADILSVTEELKKTGELEQTGGAVYIASLPHIVPSSANIEYYANIVRDCSIRRSILRLADNLKSKSFDETMQSMGLVEEAQRLVFDLTDNRQTHSYKSVKEIVPKAITAIENLYNTKNPFTGVPSGLSDLDSMTNGFQPSDLIIIGARPSVGKTALALTLAANTAIREKISTAFFSLEMSDMALMNRLIAMEARIHSQNLRTGMLKASDFPSLLEAAGRIYEAPLFIIDMPYMKMMDLRSQARKLKAQEDIKIIFVDYITLITSDNTQLPRHEQVAEISRSLKGLARELNVPIVALSQVKRDAEGKRPGLADIRESGSIEQDADVIMFLHRDRENERLAEEEKSNAISTELIISKQRNGPVGIVPIVFLPTYTKFESLSKLKN